MKKLNKILLILIELVKILFITIVWLIIGINDNNPDILIFNISKNIGIQVTKLIGVRALWASLNDLVKLAIVIHNPDINNV